MTTVYLDHASTTPIEKEVLDAMLPYFKNEYGNPSSLHTLGIQNRKVINQCRKQIASFINAKPKEIYFCSGGSEANNWALKGVAFKSKDKHEIITTKIEHHAVTHVCEFLERQGFRIRYVQVDQNGMVDLNHLDSLINEQTLLVSVILGNNEIGTIQDMKAISKVCHKHDVLVHTDAVQAFGHIPIDVDEMGIDLLSFSGHKFYGPKGIGGLYVKTGVELESLIHGGNQEHQKRSGTENVASIVGMTKAVELANEQLETFARHERSLCERLFDQLSQAIHPIRLNGPQIGEHRLPGHLNISLLNQDGNTLCFELNKRSIYASTGSACNAGDILPSHVLQAIDVPEDFIHGTIRLTVGRHTTEEEIDHASKIIIDLIKG